MASLGGDAVFTCITQLALVVDVMWSLNGSLLHEYQSIDVDQGFEPVGGVGILRIYHVQMEFNNTRVQCLANTSGDSLLASRNSTLLVQGT